MHVPLRRAGPRAAGAALQLGVLALSPAATGVLSPPRSPPPSPSPPPGNTGRVRPLLVGALHRRRLVAPPAPPALVRRHGPLVLAPARLVQPLPPLSPLPAARRVRPRPVRPLPGSRPRSLRRLRRP